MAAAAAGDWEPAWSSNHKRWFYQDRKAGKSSWDRPKGCTLNLPSAPPEGADTGSASSSKQELPPDWECEWDTKHRRFYYFNRKTRERVWKKPGSPEEIPGGELKGRSSASSSSNAAVAVQGQPIDFYTNAPELGPDSSRSSSNQESARSARSDPSDGWDVSKFLKRLGQAKASGDPDQIKVVRKEVAEHNYLIRNKWPVPRTHYVSAAECMKAGRPSARSKTSVTFSEMTTAEAALLLAAGPSRPRVCALNFANGVRVGGGYKNGAHAQEEDLCRRIPSLFTSLFNAKRDGLYPFGPGTCHDPRRPEKYSDVLFTPGLKIGRSHEDTGYVVLPADKQATVALIGAAAPNIKFAKPPDIKDLDLMLNTVRAIFLAPRLQDPEISVLILGAWGCGAFGGNPQEVGDLFCKAMVEDGLGHLYDEVHFAVPRFGEKDRNPDLIREALRRGGIVFRETLDKQ